MRALSTRLRHLAQRLLFRSRWSRLELAEIARRFGDPYALNDFMQACLDYVSDDEHVGLEDHWQEPSHTLRALRGDCEDFAVFAHHVLTLAGHESRVLCLFTVRQGHAVCVTRARNRLVTLCNEGLRELDPPPGASGLCDLSARAVAALVYRERWESCAWVHADALAELVAGRAARPFDPRYALIRRD